MTQSKKENHVGHFPTPETTNSDKFPEGLRVLAVDDNTVCLRVLEAFLLQCRYKVTVTTEAVNALKLLRENENNFDIVITDVHMLDMDGFKLLEIIGLDMDIPVIMMSSNDDQRTVMKGIEHGACDYLLKPIRIEVIKNIWQHVVRKSIVDNNDLSNGKGTIKRITSKRNKRPNSQIKAKDLKEDETHECNLHSDENISNHRRPRVAWNHELHKKFIHAFDKLGPDKAVPSKILEEMNEPGLTREKIASHLQKYRNALKKNGGQQRNISLSSNGMNGPLLNTWNGVNCLNGFRANGHRSSQTSQFGHHVQKPVAFSHSFVNPKSRLFPLNQQNLLPQQFPHNLEVVDETCQRIQVHGPTDISSNSTRMESLHPQTYLNRLKSQSFSSSTNLCNMEISSRMSDYNPSKEPRPSSFPLPVCPSDSFPVNSSFDYTDCSMPDDVIFPSLVDHNYSGIRAGQDLLPGAHEGTGLVHMDMQSSNVEQSIGIDELPLVEHPFENLDTDGIYRLSSCSSTDEDLNTALKQFHQ